MLVSNQPSHRWPGKVIFIGSARAVPISFGKAGHQPRRKQALEHQPGVRPIAPRNPRDVRAGGGDEQSHHFANSQPPAGVFDPATAFGQIGQRHVP